MVTLLDTRHRERKNHPLAPLVRKPPWLRVKAPSPSVNAVAKIVKSHQLVTVCEEAACPNRGECWQQRHATFMIMGDTCTRACAFCNVKTGIPNKLDATEPKRIASAVRELALKHVVITSVDRDDLPDGGARHFARTIAAIRTELPSTTIEVLTPDFWRKQDALQILVDTPPDVFNHNIETVPRLYPTIRPGSRYFQSLRLLHSMKERAPKVFTKSGLMVGLGESRLEVLQVMDDLRAANVDFLTVGQYLAPTRRHAPVCEFISPQAFEAYAATARAKGFLMVSASPLTRSSYHAGEDFARLQGLRAKVS